MRAIIHRRRRAPRYIMLLLACGALLGCAQTPAPPVREVFVPTPPVELIVADTGLAANRLLQVGVVVFGSGSDGAQSPALEEWLFAEISRKETQYLPYLLRNTLVASNQWGAVRVLPESDPSVDLLIFGRIERSDGEVLALQITAVDSTGRQWLNKHYMDVVEMTDYPDTTRFTPGRRFDANNFVDPFQDIYDQIANDLFAAREALDEVNLNEIQQVSELVYAMDLAPESFAQTLQRHEDGRLSVSSLLAVDDPMLNRVAEIRLRHFLFIDTVDEYYRALFEEMQPAYVLWRRFALEQIETEADSALRVFDADNYADSNSYLSLVQRYDRYKWSKIYEQEFTQLASGFNNEIAPAILELNQQVHGLSGTMDSQYRQWRGILRELFRLETGQTGAPPRAEQP